MVYTLLFAASPDEKYSVFLLNFIDFSSGLNLLSYQKSIISYSKFLDSRISNNFVAYQSIRVLPVTLELIRLPTDQASDLWNLRKEDSFVLDPVLITR